MYCYGDGNSRTRYFVFSRDLCVAIITHTYGRVPHKIWIIYIYIFEINIMRRDNNRERERRSPQVPFETKNIYIHVWR